MKEIIITKENQDQRLDKYLKRILSECSMSFIYKQLRKKNIVLNDKKATGSEKLLNGDSVKIYFSDESFEKLSGATKSDPYFSYLNGLDGKLEIIFEDENLIIINKPASVLTQKAKDTDVSINELALAYLIKKGELSEQAFKQFHPSVINRLDRNTSGIVLFAKTLYGSQVYSKMLKERDVKKIYRAIVVGKITDRQLIEGYLVKDENTNKVEIFNHPVDATKPIKTEYWPIKALDNNLTLIEIHLITGRTHQIRAHLSAINHPILGDNKYGNISINKKMNIHHQLLHAYSIEFSDSKKYIAKEPKEFNAYI